MREDKYDLLREFYPEHISLDQFHKICRMSKRGAVYLLEQGIVPHTDTGKNTWKYKIHIDDVIAYLRRREEEGDMIPCGVRSSRYKGEYKKKNNCFRDLIEPGESHQVREYFEFVYSDCEDSMTATMVAKITGFHVTSIRTAIRNGYLKAITEENKYIIPKVYLLDFVTTPQFLDKALQSDNFKRLLRGFEIWKKRK